MFVSTQAIHNYSLEIFRRSQS